MQNRNVIQAAVQIGSSFQQVQQAMLTVVTTGTLKSIANSREFIFPLLIKMDVPFVVGTGMSHEPQTMRRFILFTSSRNRNQNRN